MRQTGFTGSMGALLFAPMLFALASACGSEQGPVASRLRQEASRPNAISDQVHSGGHEGFFWLPPLVGAPTLAGTFDANQQPVVTITPLSPAGAAPIATFTTTSGPGSETVRVDATGQSYIVDWHTDRFTLDPSVDYRVAVSIGTKTLGFIDVDVITSAAQAKNVDTGQYAPLVDGKTLPIKWFLNACGSIFCEAADVCHVAGTCDPNAGACSNPIVPDGTQCGPVRSCGRADACQAGICVPAACCTNAGDCPPGEGCINTQCTRCAADADCAGSSVGSRCSNGACVACLTNTDCTSVSKPQCTSNACVACTGDDGCSGHAKARCEVANSGTPSLVGTCVDCRSNTTPLSADCADIRAAECDSTSGTCRTCSGSVGEAACVQNHGLHCEEDSGSPFNGTCVACRSSTDCRLQAPVCQSATQSCVGCISNTDCAGRGVNDVCDTSSGGCVGCLSNSDCTVDSPRCSGNAATPGACGACIDDTDCAAFAVVGMPTCDPSTGACRPAP